MNSYRNENALSNHKENCGDDYICTIRTSSESHLCWEEHFHKKKPLYFRFIADFGADNEINGSSLGNKTTISYKQTPVLNGYYIISELEDVLESGYYESFLGYNNVDWYVKEVVKSEKWFSILKTLIKMSLWLKKVKKIIKTKIFVDFVKEKHYLIKFLIIVIWLVNTEGLLITLVI